MTYGINYLIQHHAHDDVPWRSTPLGLATENFWCLLRRHQEECVIGRAFMTGVTPVATADGIDLENISFNAEFSGFVAQARQVLLSPWTRWVLIVTLYSKR